MDSRETCAVAYRLSVKVRPTADAAKLAAEREIAKTSAKSGAARHPFRWKEKPNVKKKGRQKELVEGVNHGIRRQKAMEARKLDLVVRALS